MHSSSNPPPPQRTPMPSGRRIMMSFRDGPCPAHASTFEAQFPLSITVGNRATFSRIIAMIPGVFYKESRDTYEMIDGEARNMRFANYPTIPAGELKPGPEELQEMVAAETAALWRNGEIQPDCISDDMVDACTSAAERIKEVIFVMAEERPQWGSYLYDEYREQLALVLEWEHRKYLLELEKKDFASSTSTITHHTTHARRLALPNSADLATLLRPGGTTFFELEEALHPLITPITRVTFRRIFNLVAAPFDSRVSKYFPQPEQSHARTHDLASEAMSRALEIEDEIKADLMTSKKFRNKRLHRKADVVEDSEELAEGAEALARVKGAIFGATDEKKELGPWIYEWFREILGMVIEFEETATLDRGFEKVSGNISTNHSRSIIDAHYSASGADGGGDGDGGFDAGAEVDPSESVDPRSDVTLSPEAAAERLSESDKENLGDDVLDLARAAAGRGLEGRREPLAEINRRPDGFEGFVDRYEV